MNFSEQENYKGAILEKGAKNGIAVNFTSRPCLDGTLLKFRSVCSVPNLGINETSDLFPNKTLSEKSAAFKALDVWNALDATKTLQRKATMERVELSKLEEIKSKEAERMVDDVFKETRESSRESRMQKEIPLGRWEKDTQDWVEVDSDDEEVILPFSSLTMVGAYNPWSWQTEPQSVLKEKLMKRFIKEYQEYDNATRNMEIVDAVKFWNARKPMMIDGKVSDWFSGLLVYYFWNDDFRALDAAKYFFGKQASKSMINPILWKCDFLKKNANEIWSLKLA